MQHAPSSTPKPLDQEATAPQGTDKEHTSNTLTSGDMPHIETHESDATAPPASRMTAADLDALTPDALRVMCLDALIVGAKGGTRAAASVELQRALATRGLVTRLQTRISVLENMVKQQIGVTDRLSEALEERLSDKLMTRMTEALATRISDVLTAHVGDALSRQVTDTLEARLSEWADETRLHEKVIKSLNEHGVGDGNAPHLFKMYGDIAPHLRETNVDAECAHKHTERLNVSSLSLGTKRRREQACEFCEAWKVKTQAEHVAPSLRHTHGTEDDSRLDISKIHRGIEHFNTKSRPPLDATMPVYNITHEEKEAAMALLGVPQTCGSGVPQPSNDNNDASFPYCMGNPSPMAGRTTSEVLRTADSMPPTTPLTSARMEDGTPLRTGNPCGDATTPLRLNADTPPKTSPSKMHDHDTVALPFNATPVRHARTSYPSVTTSKTSVMSLTRTPPRTNPFTSLQPSPTLPRYAPLLDRSRERAPPSPVAASPASTAAVSPAASVMSAAASPSALSVVLSDPSPAPSITFTPPTLSMGSRVLPMHMGMPMHTGMRMSLVCGPAFDTRRDPNAPLTPRAF